jgi:hypothetical protein
MRGAVREHYKLLGPEITLSLGYGDALADLLFRVAAFSAR